MQANPFVTEGIKAEHMPAGLRVKGKAIVRSIDKISAFVLRYGLVLVIFWIGCLKFTAYESKGVFNQPLIVHSWPGVITFWTCEISRAASVQLRLPLRY
jgi:hypothetical protein